VAEDHRGDEEPRSVEEAIWADFARWIRQRMGELRLNQAEAVRRSGLSDTQWRVFERGYRTVGGQRRPPASPREATLHKIADALEVAPSEVCRRAAAECTIPTFDHQAGDDDDVREALARIRRDLARLEATLDRRRG
jgi:transcriptional regulator with XRE-family HTH domain